MKKEENVYEKNEGTEVAAADSRKDEKMTVSEQTSAVLGKFKDVDALARAYGSLQAEFTRRSQRLKELERLTENFGKDAHSGVEKLRKNAQARRVEAKQFEEFLSAKEKTVDCEADARLSTAEPVDTKTVAETVVTSEKIENEDTMSALNIKEEPMYVTSDMEKVVPNPHQESGRGEAKEDGRGNVGDLYEMVRQNEDVRLRIIGEYLSSIGKSNAPLMTGGVGTLTTPPVKATSISGAGNMALLYFKSPKCDG